MTLTKRGAGYAINGNWNEIHRTLSVLADAYQAMDSGAVSVVIRSNVIETRELLAKLTSLQSEPEDTEQVFAQQEAR